MLPDRSLQLLTAYVDGELSSRQRRQVEQLLHRSQEAREVLRQLQKNTQQLQQLPRPTLPHDLSEPILQVIAHRGLTTARPARSKPRVAVPFWRGAAAAAAVVLGLGLGSYWYFASSLDHAPETAIAKRPDSLVQSTGNAGATQVSENKRAIPEPVVSPRGLPSFPSPRPQVNPDPSVRPEIDRVVPGPRIPEQSQETKPVPDSPRETPGPVLADRGMEKTVLTEVKQEALNLPQVLKATELGQETTTKKVLGELGKSSALRLEVPVSDATRAMDRLQTACKDLRINLTVDALAQGRLKKFPTQKTNYVCYLENLTPADLNRLLQQFAQVDRQSPTRKPPSETVLDRLVLTHMDTKDWQELSDLVGASLQPTAEQGGGEIRWSEAYRAGGDLFTPRFAKICGDQALSRHS